MTVQRSPIRAFNRDGIEEFKRQITEFANGYIGSISDELLVSEKYSTLVSGNVRIEHLQFRLKIEAARYLTPKIEQIQYPNKYYSVNLWGWLSAFYFDSVCPVSPDGTRQPKSLFYYMPTIMSGREIHHRHLLALPVRIYKSHGEMPKTMLIDAIDKSNIFTNELASRQDLMMNGAILEAVNLLYWDESQQRPKRGVSSENSPGSLRRFVTVIYQLDLTYDLHSLTGEQIVELLPKHEFGHWS